jgi:sugar lactone lactonase YvrE
VRRVLVFALLAGALLPASASADFGYLTQWGTRGAADGQFESGLTGIADDGNGRVLVEDSGNYRVQVFDNNGAFLSKFGSKGNGPGQFGGLDGIGVDAANNIFIADHKAPATQVERFSPDGVFQSAFKQFPENTHDMTVDKQGNVVVITGGGPPDSMIKKFDAAGNEVARWGNYGTADGQFSNSGRTQIAADAQGNLYITDTNFMRVQKFSPTGQFLMKWGTQGSGDGQFAAGGPNGIAVDSQGNVWTADPNNSRLQKFSPDGAFLAKFGSQGSGPGQFGVAVDLAADANGNLFVIDENNSRIIKLGEKTAPAPAAPPPASVTQPKGSCTPAPPNVCFQGPEDLQKLGCLRIGNFQHRFGVALKKTRAGLIVNRVSRVKIVQFSLDGGGAGSDNKRPYQIFVSGAVLKPGAHVLRATVRMQVPKSLIKRYPKRFKKTKFTRKLQFPFKTCA